MISYLKLYESIKIRLINEYAEISYLLSGNFWQVAGFESADKKLVNNYIKHYIV